MNLRKILNVALIGVVSMGIFVGCGNTKENSLNNESSKKEVKVNKNDSEVNKDVKEETAKEVTTEEVTTEEVTEESSLQIAIDGFKKYFNQELKKEELKVYSAHLSSENETEKFVVEANELVQLPYEECPKYRSEIDSMTGEIISMSCFLIKEAKDYSNFDIEKGKSLAIDFIKEHNLINDEKIEFIDNLTNEQKEFSKNEPYYFYSFKAENGNLLIRVDKDDCKVGLFKFEQPIIMQD